jgi:hypothetical protein
MLAGGKELDRLRAGLGCQLQEAWVQALVQEEVRRQDSQLGHRIPPRPTERCSHCRRGGHSAEEGAAEGGRCPRYTTELRPLRFTQTEKYFYILKTSLKNVHKSEQ